MAESTSEFKGAHSLIQVWGITKCALFTDPVILITPTSARSCTMRREEHWVLSTTARLVISKSKRSCLVPRRWSQRDSLVDLLALSGVPRPLGMNINMSCGVTGLNGG